MWEQKHTPNAGAASSAQDAKKENANSTLPAFPVVARDFLRALRKLWFMTAIITSLGGFVGVAVVFFLPSPQPIDGAKSTRKASTIR